MAIGYGSGVAQRGRKIVADRDGTAEVRTESHIGERIRGIESQKLERFRLRDRGLV